ncbi:CRISPR-associated protein Cas1 [Thermobrachium celere DSM 8682]|uniref:CRISPR-associated exonuclease Cas4 n=1 Tax=Thermobrachium celere DSM 8682 TaxID=941824 RepID=R7RUU3_9CLOT|nr:CRISPR-associated protein Cas1 [Thermobrachium celere DSM 8682]
MENYIPISSINTFVYCKRRFYLEYFLGFRTDNFYTLEGKEKHSDLEHWTDGGKYYKNIYVYSENLGVEGIIDIVLIKDGKITIIEEKRGRRAEWENDKFQVLAQAIAFEETYNKKVDEISIYYEFSNRRRYIEKTEDEIKKLKEIIENMKSIITSGLVPKFEYTNRCEGCSEKEVCLPEFTLIKEED